MSQYSILVIPENHLESKRFQLSKSSIHLGISFAALFLIFFTFMTWGFIHYRSLAKNVATLSGGEERYRSELLGKINQLENSLNRTQQFASRVESLAGVDAGKLKIGVGPIHDSDNIKSYLDKLKELPKSSDEELSAGSDQFYNRLSVKMEDLTEFANSLEIRANEVYELSQDKLSYWASTPSFLPVNGWITSDFGMRTSPISGSAKFHEGLDIAAPIGSPIYAPSDAVVSFAGHKGGYGLALNLDHGYGVSTLFGHTSNIYVKEGEKVKRGQLIASVGNSGSSTGPHLHYEVHVDGVPTDPMKFVLR
ncbi:MAG: peptidoglycan DD-metalloendopeptidase family protein [Deltaproteobacteria bacterium]|nr:peptidoglycan DD-metalloendopeptidase family protein [Deltaproteobacteria bacterium]